MVSWVSQVCHTICQNPCFKPGLMDAVFKHLSDKGLSTIRDFYIDNHFASFAQLQAKFNLSFSKFFYLQIGNFVKEFFPLLNTIPVQHVFYEITTQPPTSKHLISRFVNLFFMTTSSLHIKEVWIKDTGEVIS